MTIVTITSVDFNKNSLCVAIICRNSGLTHAGSVLRPSPVLSLNPSETLGDVADC